MIGGMHPAPVGNKVLKGVMEKNQRTNEWTGLFPFRLLSDLETACKECIAYRLEISHFFEYRIESQPE
jgi:hypothetical protein